jgi:hypothetical protein
LKVGIIGLASVGKSALFRVLTGAPPPQAGRPEARAGIAKVPDPRLKALADLYKPKKVTPATIEFVDVPGVAKGQGSALVDLPALRGVDAFLHVVRAFRNDAVAHVEGTIDPERDVEMLELELMLADLTLVATRLERLEQSIRKLNKPEDKAEKELFLRLKAHLEGERPLREMEVSPASDDARRLRNYSLLSIKPVVAAINMGDDDIKSPGGILNLKKLQAFAAKPNVALCPVAATIEAEIADLGPEDADAFRKDLGLDEPGLDRIVRSAYGLLGLLSFLTAGEDECRAWTIRRNTRAQNAAGEIHSDIERGFIRAEVVPYESLIALGSIAACRERATLRLEGKDYIVQDGDVINFRFNV